MAAAPSSPSQPPTSWSPPPADPSGAWGQPQMSPPPGGPPGNPWGQAAYGAPPPKGKAVAAMVLGIAACCIWVVPFVGPFLMLGAAVTAIVLAVLAMKDVKAGRGAGNGMAVTGLVLGILNVLIAVGLVLLVLVGGPWIEEYCRENPDTPNCDEINKESRDDARSASPPWTGTMATLLPAHGATPWTAAGLRAAA